MIRILWADDQPDVIQTFSGLLSPLDPKITQVKDGIDVLRELKTHHFDMLILDLMMPPDEWGGLWVLEEIRKAQIRIAIVVLSGEGTQNETIQALRLGARDYVTKDAIREELLERVCAVLDKTIGEIENHITTSLPTPLALPYRRYLNSTKPMSQLRRLIEFYESSLRFCCIIGIYEFGLSFSERLESPKSFSLLIRGPSMGTWNEVRLALAKRLNQDSAFFQLHDCFDNEAIRSIIELRNDISHGVEPSSRSAQELLDCWRAEVRRFVSRLWQNLRFQIFLPLGLDFDGTEFHVEGCAISGDNVTLPKSAIKTTKPMICSQPYLISGGSEKNQWVSLFPLICVDPAVEPNAWRVMIFDSLKIDKNTQILTGNERIRYLDIWSGQRNVIPIGEPKSGMLPEFLIR